MKYMVAWNCKSEQLVIFSCLKGQQAEIAVVVF